MQYIEEKKGFSLKGYNSFFFKDTPCIHILGQIYFINGEMEGKTLQHGTPHAVNQCFKEYISRLNAIPTLTALEKAEVLKGLIIIGTDMGLGVGEVNQCIETPSYFPRAVCSMIAAGLIIPGLDPKFENLVMEA